MILCTLYVMEGFKEYEFPSTENEQPPLKVKRPLYRKAIPSILDPQVEFNDLPVGAMWYNERGSITIKVWVDRDKTSATFFTPQEVKRRQPFTITGIPPNITIVEGIWIAPEEGGVANGWRGYIRNGCIHDSIGPRVKTVRRPKGV